MYGVSLKIGEYAEFGDVYVRRISGARFIVNSGTLRFFVEMKGGVTNEESN